MRQNLSCETRRTVERGGMEFERVAKYEPDGSVRTVEYTARFPGPAGSARLAVSTGMFGTLIESFPATPGGGVFLTTREELYPLWSLLFHIDLHREVHGLRPLGAKG